MHVIIQNSRFIIRDFLPEEEQSFLRLFDDEVVTRHLPKRSQEEYIQLFHSALKDYAADKTLGRWGIFNMTDNDFIGMCLLRVYNADPRQIEVGYSMHQQYWGKGIATEMAKAMIDYCFANTDAREVVAVTTLGNTASQRVLEKAGLTHLPNVIRNGDELAYFRLGRTANQMSS